MSDKQQLVEFLEAHGIIPTRQRIDLAQILLAKPQHLSAEQLMETAWSNGDRHVSKATVYNTLKLFVERGLIREIIADPTKSFYDSTTSQHGHLYNVDTGELMDLPSTGDHLGLLATLPDGVTPIGVDIVVRVKNSC
jgi:Fur family iron response transcriptional regulator